MLPEIGEEDTEEVPSEDGEGVSEEIATEEVVEENEVEADEESYQIVRQRGLTIANVSTFAQMQAAFGNPAVNVISLQDNFMLTSGNDTNVSTALTTVAGSARTVVVEGNGHTIDVANHWLNFPAGTYGTGNWDVTWQNINVYSGAYWGFVSVQNLSAALQNRTTFRFYNFNHTGNQVIHTPGSHVHISGNFSTTRVGRFTNFMRATPLVVRRGNYSTTNAHFLHGYGSEVNFYVRNVTIAPNSTVNLLGANAGNIHLTGTAAQRGHLSIGANSQVTFTTRGHARWYRGTGATATPWWEGEGNNIFVENGDVIVHEGVTMNLNPMPNFGSVNIMPGTAAAPNRFVIHPHATVNIHQPINNDTTNTTFRRNTIGIAAGTQPLTGAGNAQMHVYGDLNVHVAGTGGGNHVVNLGNNAQIHVRSRGGSSGSFNISVEGRPTMASDVINVGNNSQLHVEPGANLTIDVNGRTTGAGHMIQVGNNSSLVVDSRGTLDIMTDGTAEGMNLIRFGTGGSFRFADAERVNLQRTSAIGGTGTANGLIGMAGNAGFLDVSIQEVSQWNRGNVSAEPTHHWLPMYGMRIAFPQAGTTLNNFTTTRIDNALSLTSAMVADFRNNFNTQNVQRVLFERIPDVEVELLSVSTDDRNSDSSRVIRGVTNPGAFVRITEKVINDSATSALPLGDTSVHTIPSPVEAGIEGQPDGFSESFTVQADSFTGEFTFTLPAGSYLTAESTLRVFAFLNGKYGEVTQTVLDRTAPTAEAVAWHMVQGDTLPNVRQLIENLADTNPTSRELVAGDWVTNDAWFTVSFQNQGAAQTASETVGEHDIIILVSDPAGNTREVTARLIVHETAGGLVADDFEIGLASLLTDAGDGTTLDRDNLEQLILERSNARAHLVEGGRLYQLTDAIRVIDIGDLSLYETIGGDFTIVLVVRDEDSGLPETLVIEITMTVVGNLMFHSAPDRIDFGRMEIQSGAQLFPVYNYDEPLKIADSRAVGARSDWQLRVSVTEPLHNAGRNHTLLDGFAFAMGGATYFLNTSELPILSHRPSTVASLELTNVFQTWKADEGLHIHARGHEVRQGSYVGELKWTLADVVPNE